MKKAVRRKDAAKTPSEIVQLIVLGFERSYRPGLSKAAQLYDAISALISSGQIEHGVKLPGERELCAALGISLGTAQKSLNLLMRDGDLTREHGRGTFVRHGRYAMRELWHYRFRESESEALLPVYAKVVSLEFIKADSKIEKKIGRDPAGYLRVCRLINIDDRLACWSEMYLGATRFGKLAKLPLSNVECVNLKQILNDQFDAPTLAIHQTALIHKPSSEICKSLDIPARSACLMLQIVAVSRRNEPITFQKIIVPPNEYEMELSETPFELARSIAA